MSCLILKVEHLACNSEDDLYRDMLDLAKKTGAGVRCEVNGDEKRSATIFPDGTMFGPWGLQNVPEPVPVQAFSKAGTVIFSVNMSSSLGCYWQGEGTWFWRTFNGMGGFSPTPDEAAECIRTAYAKG